MNSIKYGFRTVSKQQTDGPIGHFLHWWWQQICAMRPAALKNESRQRTSLVFRVRDDIIEVLRVRQEEAELLGQTGLIHQDSDDALLADRIRQQERQKSPHRLLLPENWVAVLPVSLPVAARDNLEQVLRFEMDRQTPFKAADVYYDYQLYDSDPAATELSLELAVVPRQKADAVINKVKVAGGHPEVMDVVSDNDVKGQGFNLLPHDHGSAERPLLSGINGILLIAAVLLFLITLAIPYMQRYDTLEDLRAQVSKARQVAGKVSQVRQDYQSRVEDLQGLFARRQASAGRLAVLNALSDALPDDTWLSSVDIREQTIRIQGESDAASRLIGVLEESPLFNDTRLTASVTQNRRSGKEAFSLETRIVQPAGESAP